MPRTYYVSAAGLDTNAGTLAAPWKTITRVNTAFTSGAAGLNYQVLFNRGNTFYGRLVPPTNLGTLGWLKIGAYGSGAAPIISGYKILNTASGWTAFDANTWQLGYGSANSGVTYTGYDSVQGGTDVGILKVNGVIQSVKRGTQAALANQWDYFSTGTTLYVRSTANPTTLAADIQCSTNGNGIVAKSGIEIADLHFIGHGGHGISMPGLGSSRIRVLRNTVNEIGGSYLSGTLRYGNGVQVWNGGNSSEFYGENNTVYDCYDTAYTVQGGTSGVAGAATNITWRRNLTYRCSQAEEYWYQGSGAGLVNVVSEYNTNLFAGYGWGSDIRPDPNVRAALLTSAWDVSANLTIRHNIFYDGRVFSYHQNPPLGLISDRNVILMRPGTLMQFQTSQTVEQAAAWSATSGREQNSIVGLLPSSSSVNISDADVTAAIAALDVYARTGQKAGSRVMPIHAPWRAP
jgi:hypothetical protein